MTTKKIGVAVAALLLIGVIETGCWLMGASGEVAAPAPARVMHEPSPADEPVDAYEELYPVGEWYVSQKRLDYVSGEMLLEIPRMNFAGPVLAGDVTENFMQDRSYGVSQEILKKGVGLFGFSQMPGRDNANVCIAGHRDIDGMEFYYIDQITEGDLMYLTYEGVRYTYEYLETVITDTDDWEMIRVREYGCLTLQSCEPINVASHRIFVVGKLVMETPLEE